MFRYDTSNTWYKGNTHIHTPASDGGKPVAEVAEMYAGVGYDFLFRTDHSVASDVTSDGARYPLLWMDGIELDGHDAQGDYYHVVGLGTFTGLTREETRAMGLTAAMQVVREQNGLLILAHPQWTGNSFEAALRWDFDGVEVYNYVCHWLNGKGDGGAYWNAMLGRPNTLTSRSRTLGFACDDAHLRPEHPGWNGGWIMINVPECSPPTLMDAIRAGNFYSSTGPDFYDIAYDGERVTFHTSPVQFARLVGPAHYGKRTGNFEGTLFTEAAFSIPPEWAYCYLEIEDAQGHRAWTNTLFEGV
ncbi:MAG: hypothetical protein JXA33_08950 [Anaerolineae bacterium]|nr:hypothetical protein [Anaerolineae bacterium]